MSGSHRPSLVRNESPDSLSWWDRDPLQIGKRAVLLRQAGNSRAAEKVYREGYQAALKAGEKIAAVRYLMSAGGCLLLDFRYGPALTTFLDARALAVAAGDSEDIGAISFNLSSVYLQVWDLPAAIHAAEEGLAVVRDPKSTPTSEKPAYFQPQLMLQLGRLHSLLADGKAFPLFSEGIEGARMQGRAQLEAQGWDLLGEQYLAAHHLPEAERCFGEALRLRTYSRLQGEIGLSYSRLGALNFAQGNLPAALSLTSRALKASRAGAPSWPAYRLLHLRGQIRLAMKQRLDALADLSSAVDSAAQWRLSVVPARSSLTNANIALDDEIYRSFVEASADQALATGDNGWAARAFGALEVNRAASLRESLALADVWRAKLPEQYWEMLGQLGATPPDSVKNKSLHLKLTEMEAQAGAGFQGEKDENFASRASLIHFQEGLRESELFLSFFLGSRNSYLWAVSRNSLRLYKLRSGPKIAKRVQVFREAVPAGGREAIRLGRQLYQDLFGQLSAEELNKAEWLLSLDGALLEVPYAALVTEQQGGTVYLIEKHSLQAVPGALLLRKRSQKSAQTQDWFLGIGDPVYNRADSRWQGRRGQNGGSSLSSPWSLLGMTESLTGWTGEAVKIQSWMTGTLKFWRGARQRANSTVTEPEELERLVGSGQEVAASAEVWSHSGRPTRLLTGPEAQRAPFLALLKEKPAVIHLATHILTQPAVNAENGESYIAFSLPGSAGTDSNNTKNAVAPGAYLSRAEIAALHVPDALVVMTGCSSGTGDIRPGAGLLGLTRAWQMAGAAAVVATAWPVEDSSGEVFARFYRHLEGNSAAEALRLTQIELVHGNTWESAPANWASYQVSGGVR